MLSGIERVEIVFELDSIDAEDAAKRSIEVLGLGDSQVNFYEEAMSAKTALAKIAREGKPSFNIDADTASVHFSTIRSYKQQSLTIVKREACELSTWEEIVRYFDAKKGFTQACLLSDNYTFWQNAADPLLYQASGRTYDGLPMISNGLPSPLHKLVIDTSCNPGRRTIKIGYVEMVGHVMWLAPRFWNLVGDQRRKNLLSTTVYQVSELPNGILRLVVSGEPFVDETTRDAQEDLRRLLFS